jgi:3-oxoacyl-[acyl-carrier-protein] synthase 3
LSLEESKVPANIAQAANTSAGSIPILLDQLVRDGRLRLDGTQSIILSGFGAGLAWGHLHLSI